MEQAFQAEETSRHACVGHQASWNDQRVRHKARVGEMRVERRSEARPWWTSLCRLKGVNFNLEPVRAIEDLHTWKPGGDRHMRAEVWWVGKDCWQNLTNPASLDGDHAQNSLPRRISKMMFRQPKWEGSDGSSHRKVDSRAQGSVCLGGGMGWWEGVDRREKVLMSWVQV